MKNFGVQLFTVRNYLNSEEQIKDTLTKIQNMGYSSIQTIKNVFNVVSYQKFGEIAKDTGLEICGTFDDFDMMQNNPKQFIENHSALNTKITGIGMAGDFQLGFKDSEIDSIIEKFKIVCDNLRPFKFTYHNHSHEFIKYRGKPLLDYFIENTPEDVFSFCLDTYWTHYGGGDVVEYITKLAGILDILHLKDYGRTSSGVAPVTSAIGDGNLNWDKIIDAAEQAGVKYYVVEQDDCLGESPFDALARSREFLEKYN